MHNPGALYSSAFAIQIGTISMEAATVRTRNDWITDCILLQTWMWTDQNLWTDADSKFQDSQIFEVATSVYIRGENIRTVYKWLVTAGSGVAVNSSY